MNKVRLLQKTIFLFAMCLSGYAMAGPILWVGDGSGRLGTVDVATGNVNVIGNMGTTMTDIAFDASGNLYGISFSHLYAINSSTAAATLIGQHSLSSGAKNSLVFSAGGDLYAANNSLYSLDIGTGASSLIGNGGASYVSSGDLAFVGGNLYLSSTGGFAGDKLVSLDTLTGAGTNIGDIGSPAVFGLATDNNIDLYGLSGTTVLSINTATGAGTALVSYSGQGLGGAWGTAFYSEAGAVPEPASIALLGLGLLGLGWVRRRKHS